MIALPDPTKMAPTPRPVYPVNAVNIRRTSAAAAVRTAPLASSRTQLALWNGVLAPCGFCPGCLFLSTYRDRSSDLCLAGKHASDTGLFACAECPLGSSISDEGKSDCLPCDKGRYSN